jgi:TPR repeat protein/tRNA A-37 threonylcarbamoyl transferase component Bud32
MTQTLLGTILDNRYELIDELGRGQGGVVFRARHVKLERIFAVKVLLDDVLADPVALGRFEREAKSAAALSHPNIVSVVDLGMAEAKHPFLVMEYISGVHLGFVFGTEGRLKLPRAVRITSQICSALDHAHRAGVVHRDLKPTNVMLLTLEEMPDFVKVVDFGIAKRYNVEEDGENPLTMAGQIFGTPTFMSPEQCQGIKLDPRSDVYSMGVLFFKMLTGALPISGSSLLEIMQAHVLATPATFEQACPSVHFQHEIKQVVYRALEKDPNRRQQSMAAFREELTAAFAGTATTRQHSMITVQATRMEGQQALDALRERCMRGEPAAMYELSQRLEASDAPATRGEAAHWLQKAAELGIKEAQYLLGNHLLIGDGYAKDPLVAVQWFTKSAQQNYAEAQLALGACFETGEGVQSDLPAALHCYRGAFANGNQEAKNRLARGYRQCLELGIEVPGLMEWLMSQAELQDAESMYALGSHHLQSPDPRQRQHALQLVAQAAAQGHKQAIYALGMSQTKKEFENFAEAVKNLSSAYKDGHKDAPLHLAYLYRHGLGTAVNGEAASNLLEDAAQAGNLQARSILGAALLLGDGVHRNITRGITMLRDSANQGCHFGEWKLALCFRNGIGCAKDARETEAWFARAASGRFPQSVPWSRQPNPLSFEEAVKFFRQIQTTNLRSTYWLAICQEEGLGGMTSDAGKALDLYRQAAGRGVNEAQNEVKRLTASAQTAQLKIIR